MNTDDAIKKLQQLEVEYKEKVLPTKWFPNNVIGASYMVDASEYAGWYTKTLAFIVDLLSDDNEYVRNFRRYNENYHKYSEAAYLIITNLRSGIEEGFIVLKGPNKEDKKTDYIPLILSNFHKFVKQLKYRHDKRNTVDISDEYDVQYLLQAILSLFYEDVRPEEYVPSYAYGASRVDFFLKKEKTFIEVKKTNQNLSDKKLRNQLIIDIEQYQRHQDCEKLICFIYDPDELIKNPYGLINDLEKQHKGFVEVYIEPK